MALRDPGTAASRIAAVGLGLVLVLVCLGALVASQRLGARITLASGAAFDEDVFQDLQYHAALEQAALATYRVDRSPQTREEFREHGRHVDAALAAATAADAGEDDDGTDDVALLAMLERTHDEFRDDAERLVATIEHSGRLPADAAFLAELDGSGRAFHARLNATEEEHSQATSAALTEAQADGRLLRLGTPITLALTVVLLTALWLVGHVHQRAVKRQVLHVALTGLPHRLLFADRAGQALAAATRSGARPVVMMLDLDRFKEVNDTLGHRAGDDLLVQLAQRLRAALRPNDTVARFGGDEFAVLLADGGRDLGTDVATRILDVLAPPFVLDGVSVGVEASIGVAAWDGGLPGATDVDEQVEDVLRQADTAMYVAKSEGSGFSHYAADGAATTATDHLTLLGELREALDRDQLELYYQPKIAVATEELTGVEALVRWNHPVRGLVPPDQFIPLAEKTTLIHRLTTVVTEKALRFARAQLDAGRPIPVAVNVSARTLLDRSFPARVAELVAAAGVPAELLNLEITESTIMVDPDRALAVLRELHGMGIKLSVDDFGTGYSSMSYLKLLPVDELKIDRSFVRFMIRESDDAVLVQSAIDLGHNLNHSVVAAGVEDGDTLAALSRLGADTVQGYYFAKPLPEAALRAWIGDRQCAPGPGPVSATSDA
jgi:diguanylate cyclase (GGDEF)-like protein